MLDHVHRQRRQLFDLVASRLAYRSALALLKDVAAAAALGPVLDHLIHGAGRQQVVAAPFVTGLATTPSP
jgi:hypothetical protein